MNIRFLLKLLFLLYVSSLYSHTDKDSIYSKSIDTVSYSITSPNLNILDGLDEKFPLRSFKYDNNIFQQPDFTFKSIENEFGSNEKVSDSRKLATSSFSTIDEKGSWISSLTNKSIATLPVGVKYDVNGVEYSIGIIKAKIEPQYTTLTVFARIRLPQTDERGKPMELFFGSNNIKLSHQGGIVGEASLVLLGDVFIPFNGGSWLMLLKGGFDYKTGKIKREKIQRSNRTKNITYITIDCDGVKDMELQGEIQLSRKVVLPTDEKGKLLPPTKKYTKEDESIIQIPNRVTGVFNVTATDWNNMVVDINISPFVLTKHPKKFMFSVNKAVFDFSDLRTDDVKFPQYYYDNNLLFPSRESWRGIYIQSLEVALPKEFKTKKSITQKGRVSFKAMDMIIDAYGVSGSFSAEKIIPLESGRTSDSKAWAFSVDKIGVEIATNKFIGGSFGGRILLPISKKRKKNSISGMGYTGIFSEEEYSIVVSTLDTLSFDIFKAKAQLLPNSAVELRVVDGNFRPKAVLNGKMAIFASQRESLANEGQKISEDETVQFKGIKFQNLVLQTESPQITASYFGYEDKVKLANFPVSIGNISFLSDEQEAGLEFDLMVNLMGEDSKGFAADTRLGIYGKFREENYQYKQSWKYDRLELSEINLEVNMGVIELKGSLLLMDNDPIYGNGFSAEIKGTFGSFGPITCKTIFGKKEFRYWYVDGAVHGLTIPVGPFKITGFAGGAFYKMSRKPNAGASFSPSGLSYIPNADSGLGLKSMVHGAIADEGAIAVSAGFEIEFNRSGGVNRMGFYGEAQVMQAFNFPNPVGELSGKLSGMVKNEVLKGAMDSKAGKTFLDKATEEYESDIVGEASISAKTAMEFDFVNKSFHATLDLYVNVAGGIIAGRASRGRAGWGVIHLSKDEWYVHMGTPTDRLGLKMGIGSFSMETGGYFMLGDNIPGSPPPPPEVAQILGVEAEVLNYMRDENSLGNGRGFAFGSDFKIDTGNINFLALYGRFQMGIGFDLMLKDYGDARCVNTGDGVGVNGWYANGQSYAYMQGELGIKIRLFFKKKKISIFKGGAAILLQAKGPNPFWMQGYAGGYYDLLGGLIKGSYRFKITVGEECEFEDASPFQGIRMITDVIPNEGDGGVDVFAAPQATFAMKVNQPIIIPEDDGDKAYKVVLEQFTVKDESGKEIQGIVEWGYLNDRATFISEDILPPNTKLKATVEVSFQKKVDGVFETILDDGEKAIEIEERNFTTGAAPNHIPLHNIKYSYPVVDQQSFYSGEYPTGYIKLKRGQDYLFENAQWKSVVKYVDENGKIKKSAFNYNNADNKVNYNIPKTNKETSYLMTIVSTTKSSGSTTNNETVSETTNFGDGNTIEVKKNKAKNVLKEGEIDRLSYEFTSSKYKTFSSKIKNIKITNDNWGRIASDLVYLTSSIQENEGFDLVELRGTEYSDRVPLISVESTLQDAYFVQDIDPIIYQKYGLDTKYTINRNSETYGFRPKKALPISTSYITSLEHNVNTEWRSLRFPYIYNLPEVYKIDYLDISDRVLNDFVNGSLSSTDPALQILDNEFMFMRYGNYDVTLKYMLPGGINGTSATYKFKNPIEIR